MKVTNDSIKKLNNEFDDLESRIQERTEELNKLMDIFNNKITKRISNPEIHVKYLDKRIDFVKWMNKKFDLQFKGDPNSVFQREVFYCELGYNLGSEQNDKRPVVILQNNIGNTFGNTTLIAPITTYEHSTFVKINNVWYIKFIKNNKEEKKKLDFYEIPIQLENNNKANIVGAVNVVHMREVSKKRLASNPIGKITEDNFNEIKDAIIKNISII